MSESGSLKPETVRALVRKSLTILEKEKELLIRRIWETQIRLKMLDAHKDGKNYKRHN